MRGEIHPHMGGLSTVDYLAMWYYGGLHDKENGSMDINMILDLLM